MCVRLPSDQFTFVGFLPQKDKALRAALASWNEESRPIIFYESTRRLTKTLNLIRQYHPESRLCVGRELTKLHEEIRRLSLADALIWADDHTHLKGELVVMISGFGIPHDVAVSDHVADIEQLLIDDLRAGKRFKEILRERKDCGLSRADLYQLLTAVKTKIKGQE